MPRMILSQYFHVIRASPCYPVAPGSVHRT
jgi:hypothetical protein